MTQHRQFVAILLLTMVSAVGCRKKINQQSDEIYSRHLQEHVKLTIISTPKPENGSDFNLLLLNDGQSLAEFRIRQTMDSLYSLKLLKPLLVIGIEVHNRLESYGVAGFPDYQGNGAKADHYASFVTEELIAFARKKAGVKTFASVTIAGCSLGGLSAFDIGWNNGQKIDKVGVFSGSFWWRDKATNDTTYRDDLNRIALKQLAASRKRPKLQFWLYDGLKEETADRDQDGIIDVVDDTRDVMAVLKDKKKIADNAIVYVEAPEGTHDYASWSKVLPKFLLWVAGK